MQRRTLLSGSLGAAALAIFASSTQAAQNASTGASALPSRKQIRVAFMLGTGSNVIDTAGPWEVFQDVMLDGAGDHAHPFELFTVGPTEDVLTMTGGLQVKPHYSIKNAPQPN